VTFAHEFTVKYTDIENEFDTLGFILRDESQLGCCYIADILPRSMAATYPRWFFKLIGCFMLCVGDDIVSTKQSAETALSRHLVDALSPSQPHKVLLFLPLIRLFFAVMTPMWNPHLFN
jgi:hypothetical protein